nr:hypothetical protein [uncultured Methanoregula sp.]
MKFEKHILESFLWETHDIDRGVSIRNAIKQNNKQENIELCHRLDLHNLFLFRRVHDPGFYLHVTQELEKNPKLLNETVRYIRRLLDQHVFNEDFLQFSKPQKAQDKNPFRNGLAHGMHFASTAKDLAAANTVERQKSQEYFEKRLQYALEHDLTDEYIVISQLRKDYDTGNFFGFELFTENVKHSEFADRMKWFSEGMSFFYRNICWPERYVFYTQTISGKNDAPQKPKLYDTPLFHFLSCGRDSIEFFLKEFALPSPYTLEDVSEVDLIRYSIFSNAALSIASELWFASLPDDEKISKLNSTYPFTILEKDFIDLDNSLMSIYGNLLFAQNYFDEAKIIYSLGLEKAITVEEKYHFISNLATAERELGDYENALKNYSKAYELTFQIKLTGKLKTKKIPKNRFKLSNTKNIRHRQLIELLNVTEIRFRLGQNKIAQKNLDTVIFEMRKLQVGERAQLISKIAIMSRRLGNYQQEFDFLKMLRSIDDDSFELANQEKLENRWALLTFPYRESREFFDRILGLYGPDYAEKTLRDMLGSAEAIRCFDVISKHEKAETWMDRASAALNSFQFESALKWIEKAIENDRHPHLLSEYAYYLHLNQKNAEAVKILNDAFGLTQDLNLKVKIKTFSCVFQLALNDVDASLEHAREIIELLYSSEVNTEQRNEILFKFLHQVSEELVLKNDRVRLLQVMEKIEEMLNKYNDSLSTADLISSSLLSAWASDEAHHFFDRVLINGNLSRKDIASAFFGKGKLFATYGDHVEAVKSFQEALKIIPERDIGDSKLFVSSLYAELAISYSVLMDMTNAGKMIQIACDIDPTNKYYSEIKRKIDAFLFNYLSYESVTDEDVKTVFRSAETRVLDLYNKIDASTGFDFGPEIGLYAKGIEMLLDVKVVPLVKKVIVKKYNILQSQDLWKSPFDKIPFKNVFDPNKAEPESIALGQWAKIRFFKEKSQINKDIYDLCIESYGENFEKIVLLACEKIYKERNESSHNKIKTKQDVLDKRKEIIEPINNLIDLFYTKKKPS